MMTERLLWPLTRLGTTLDEYQRAKASARRTFGLLETPPTIVERENPVRLPRARGEVAFDRVEFRYPSRQGDMPVLDELSFRIAPGETLGVAGPTGAGKSTVIKLLLRFYEVTGGAVRLDGHDVRDLSLSDLRNNIALVSQDVYLFHGTIRENIAYVTPDSAPRRGHQGAQLARSTTSWLRWRRATTRGGGAGVSSPEASARPLDREGILKDAPS